MKKPTIFSILEYILILNKCIMKYCFTLF